MADRPPYGLWERGCAFPTFFRLSLKSGFCPARKSWHNVDHHRQKDLSAHRGFFLHMDVNERITVLDLAQITELIDAIILPLLGCVALFFAKFRDGEAARWAERQFMGVLVVMTLVTLRYHRVGNVDRCVADDSRSPDARNGRLAKPRFGEGWKPDQNVVCCDVFAAASRR
jgi:hypothetical protein